MNIVGVKFSRSGRVSYCDPAGLSLAVGDRVVVEAPDGPREGEVVIAPDQVLFSNLVGPMDPVLRVVSTSS